MQRILVTGSSGLVGTALSRAISAVGADVVPLDIAAVRGQGFGDVRSTADLTRTMVGCTGVVHLAAVSRVIAGEQRPDLCRETNVGGTNRVLSVALEAPHRPWVLYASSREVYGQPDVLPVTEDAPYAAINIYGRSKIAAERAVLGARERGLRTAVVRLSNVYGSTDDHADRVVPAFARRAGRGQELRVDGMGHTFDFTHIDDTTRGLMALIHALDAGREDVPPIHLLTGEATTLGQLADLAVTIAGTGATIREAPPRSYDVSQFYGDPTRALRELNWRAQVSVRAGLTRLIADFQALDNSADDRRSAGGDS